uniref:alpha/beta fold hydrolase n=1 Tax=uncultured Rhizobium sp. TaxID=155567 RepID=UPI002632D42E|nr:alpha/beta hydrolase [uncultured Rhizobium sp.]
MSKLSLAASAAFVLSTSVAWACTDIPESHVQKVDVGYTAVNQDIKLRRVIVHNADPKGTVLLLHGFPETMCAWVDVSLKLGEDYDVHAIDWPGYGRSTRPPAEDFSYAPKAYADVLKAYIETARIRKDELVIYATDVAALPVLLLALEDPRIAQTIIVGDFAPFNRPDYMYETLQNLKLHALAEQTHAFMNKNRDDILENAYRRGLPKDVQFDISPAFKADMYEGWKRGGNDLSRRLFHYYSNFTRDQDFFESNLANLKTRVKVVWGENDTYIKKEMGIEFARKANAELNLLPGIGHYPHLQDPERTVEEIRASFR